MKRYSLNNIINALFNNDTTMDWYRMYDLARSHVAMSARGDRRIRIDRREWWSLGHHGIFDRLMVDIHDDDSMLAYYVAGQDYQSEMATLRDLFDTKRK